MSMFSRKTKKVEIGGPLDFQKTGGASYDKDTHVYSHLPEELGLGTSVTQEGLKSQPKKTDKKAEKKSKGPVIGAPIAGSFTHDTHAQVDPNSPTGISVCFSTCSLLQSTLIMTSFLFLLLGFTQGMGSCSA